MCRILGLLLILIWAPLLAAAAESNPVRAHSVPLGPQASRIIIGFRAHPGHSIAQTFQRRARAQSVVITQADTTPADVTALAGRVGVAVAKSRQITPSMHVIYLQQTVYGAHVQATLEALRADPEVKFAEVDERRHVSTVPNDPLFQPTSNASGQWYIQTPNASSGDLAATDAVSAWSITTGSTGTVIADVDTGVRFDHPDLLRAGFGGRLLPGFDFVDQDFNPTTGAALGTYLIANDGDGWDPDPSDPGDWINSTDQQNSLFPSTDCAVQDSSWHGTRVVGILGAITNNDVGIAGMTWGPLILPVRALGKCGGYDSDIIAGIEWAAGMSVSTAANIVPNNPYPADIINLSLGASGACSSDYQEALSLVTAMGVLVVISAGNQSGSVDSPGNCSALVAGVIAVAGLRNVGTKVGYSSFGPEVGIAAPAGNCINSSGACLRSIDSTVNLGLTTPAANGYTDQLNPNLGTSFSAPIVSGIAALMRAANANLTPAQLVARLESSATAFPPNTANIAVCPSLESSSDECACPPSGQCGAGMANALSAVNAALNPIAAVSFPATFAAGSPVKFDAGGSAAACRRSISAYAWSAGSGLTIVAGAGSAQLTVMGSGTLKLTVTDSSGATDEAIIDVGATSATTSAPAAGGASACPTTLSIQIASPTITESFSPASTAVGDSSTLTIVLSNANEFDLTQTALTDTLPSSLVVANASAPSTTCAGGTLAMNNSATGVTLSNAVIPAQGNCSVTVSVTSKSAGTYTNTLAKQALSTGPAGGNVAQATASLTLTAPTSSGGGALRWMDLVFAAVLLWAVRRAPPRAGCTLTKGVR